MAALPASGFLQLGTDGATGRSINSAFGYGNDMASYQGTFYVIGSSVGQFPKAGNSFGMNKFYSTDKIPGGSRSLGPTVTATNISGTGSVVTITYNSTNKFATGDVVVLQNFKRDYFFSSPINGSRTVIATPASNQIQISSTETTFYTTFGSGSFGSITISSIIIPIYGLLNVTTQGDQGGSSGSNGYNIYGQLAPSAGSSSNIQTNFGGYVVSSAGAGGPNTPLNLNPQAGSYGPLITTQFTNPSAGGSGPASGATVSVAIGPGGAGGLGGPIYDNNGNFVGYNTSGPNGGPGYIYISWS